MAPVMQMETECEEQQAISERHRVLIAAAAAALVGSRFRILEINLAEESAEAGWKLCGRPAKRVTRAVLGRYIIHAPKRPARRKKEEIGETSNHT